MILTESSAGKASSTDGHDRHNRSVLFVKHLTRKRISSGDAELMITPKIQR